MVMAVIYFMGAVGGAHLNPAVTLAFAVRRNFPWDRVPRYIAAQFVGGIAAACFLRVMFGNVGLLGATVPGPGISDLKTLILEVVVNRRFGQRNSRHRVGCAKYRQQRSDRGRRVYCACRAVGGADQRRLDESRSVVRARLCSAEIFTPTGFISLVRYSAR